MRALYAFTVLLALTALAFAGALYGARTIEPSTHTTELGEVQLTVTPATRGRVDVRLPAVRSPLEVRALAAPLRLNIRPLTVNPVAVIALARGDDTLISRTKEQLRSISEREVERTARQAGVYAALFASGGLLLVLLLRLVFSLAGRRS